MIIMKMQRGISSMMMLVIVFGFIMLLPLIASEVFPYVKYLMMFFFCIVIYTFVRGILGPGALTYIVSAVLIYIFVWRLWSFFAMGYMIYILIGFGLASVIIFAMPHGGMGAKAGRII